MNELTNDEMTAIKGGNLVRLVIAVAAYLFSATKTSGGEESAGFPGGFPAGATDLPEINTSSLA